jgi:hypothetical protein
MLLRQRFSALLGGHSMTKITSLQAIAAALLAFGLAAAPAQAGPNRTFVSGTGTDSGTCTRTAPCRTFAFALGVTTAGGELDVLDPAGYGAVIIINAISIVNDGAGTAGITAGADNAITINAGTSDSVHLRGLTLTGLGTGTNGILFNSGGNLAIENCVILNFTNAGINIAPSASMTHGDSLRAFECEEVGRSVRGMWGRHRVAAFPGDLAIGAWSHHFASGGDDGVWRAMDRTTARPVQRRRP